MEYYQLYTLPAAPSTTIVTPTLVPTPLMYAYSPVFTLDGLNLVFEGYNNTVDAIFEVNIAKAIATPGTGITQLSLPVTNETIETYDYLPSVSPDGTQVSFSRDTYTIATDIDTYDIYVLPIATSIPISGTGLTNLATSNTATVGTSYGPMYLDNSGKTIVYLSNGVLTSDGAYNIFEMNPDGSTTGLAKTQLTSSILGEFFKEGD